MRKTQGASNTTTTYFDRLAAWDPAGGVVASSATLPAGRYGHGAAWDGANNRMVIACGSSESGGRFDTWSWDGADWLGLTAPDYTFDLRTKADSIWNFTTIHIPLGTTVRFNKNAANNGVLWLASENVTIDGTVNASGESGGWGNSQPGTRAGPGGYDGGATGAPGNGPGAGLAGSRPDNHAKHADASGAGPYGTLFAQPAFGGSGGGGNPGNSSYAGSSGGAGGGAVVISSSRDITVNGGIYARGGSGGGINSASYAGDGSGGLIRLVADRVILGPSGVVDAGERNSTGWGRVRLEGYARLIPSPETQLKGSTSLSVPVLGNILNQAGGRLLFTKVDGETVTNPPKGDELNPDVIFSATGDVVIEVQAINIPDGVPVTVSIDHSIAGMIELPAETLQQCKALFTATIPAGTGVMQAFATYNVGGPAAP